jgi:hypothetical protein
MGRFLLGFGSSIFCLKNERFFLGAPASSWTFRFLSYGFRLLDHLPRGGNILMKKVSFSVITILWKQMLKILSLSLKKLACVQ